MALSHTNLVSELSILIEQTQTKVVQYANSNLTLLFGQIGKRINEEVLNNERAEYGKQIVSTQFVKKTTACSLPRYHR